MGTQFREPRLLVQVVCELKSRGCRGETQKAYCRSIAEFIRYHGMTHPREMGYKEIEEYLNHLSRDLNRAPATRKKALHALLFLYRRVLKRNVRGWHSSLKSQIHPQSQASVKKMKATFIERMLAQRRF